MTAKYLKRSNFLEAVQKVGDSPAWKSILRCRSLLRKGLRWIVGTGEQISFWWDNWLDNTNLVEILDKDCSMLSNPDCTVSAFITQDKMWDINKLRIVLNNDPIFHKFWEFQYLSLHMKTPIAGALPDEEHLAHVLQHGLPIRVLAKIILLSHSNGFGSLILYQR